MLLNTENKILKWLTLSVSLSLCGATAVSAKEYKESLTLEPKQCVALTQGQQCYVDVSLTWRSPERGNYCLFSTQQSKPLICWTGESTGRFSQEFESDKNVVYTLRLQGSDRDRATQLLKVTWVHQKKGQPRLRWRIF